MRIGDVPDPIPGPGELLARIHATALNRLDLAQRQGWYPVPPGAPATLGVEMAGEILGWGDGVTGWSRGDRVCALLLGGGYAEQVAFPAAMAMALPPNLSYDEGAGIPEVFLTAYLNLFTVGNLRPGGFALIHGGASGVGTAAIQLVRESGARAIVTVGSQVKAERCRALGAVAAINYHDGPFEPAVREATGGRGVDVILDMVGAPYWDQNVACLAPAGRLILVSAQGGTTTMLNISALQSKRARVIGTMLRPLPLAEKAALTEQFWSYAMPLFADGRLKPIIDRVYPLEEAPEAHRHMQSNANIGKIVLRVP
jgi:putative PIG3 family NAD(P)H quinone oxidoreductase